MNQKLKATDRERIVKFIVRFHKKYGYAPSVRQCGEAVGLSSPSTIHAHLMALVAEGRIKFDPHTPRSIRVSA